MTNYKASQGAPVPSSIADALRGRYFECFHHMTQAFWVEVTKDPALSPQFTEAQIQRMRRGLAPIAQQVDQAKGRKAYELDHVIPVSEGGEVYDLDNIWIMTPRALVEMRIHSSGDE